MQHFVFLAALLAAVATARDFTLYSEPNMAGEFHRETREDDDACWNLDGAGDNKSSVGGAGCTTFFSERDCTGSSWENTGDAATVPGFLDNHIWSFKNQCPCPDPSSPCQFESDGQCQFGYAACLQKMGCGDVALGADCAVAGCTVCN